MPALLPAFIRDNPWWKGGAEITKDADLNRFDTAAVRFEHPIPFDLRVDAVFTLRGPRQVGKSTLLKRAIRDLLLQQQIAPRCVLYTDVEAAGLTTVARLRNALTSYVAWARTAVGDAERLYLFLDEVTGIKDWGGAIRAMYRDDTLRDVTVVATGSHALDLASGGEIAPGRRGERLVEEPDWIMMPLAFRDYVTAHAPAVADALPPLDLFDPATAYAVALEIQLQHDTLHALFDRYLLTGGYPHAMSEEQETGRIGNGAYRIYRDAIIGQMRRAGHDLGPFREVVAWAADHRLGQEFSWSDVSANTEIGSKDTARRYLENAERLYLWHILYRAQAANNPTPALRSPKKLFPVDPFAWHVLAAWAGGELDPWSGSHARLQNATLRGAFVEAVAGDHFMRGYGRFALFHRGDRGDKGTEEIDFVLHRPSRQARIEVKYRETVKATHWKHLANHGGGIIATRSDLQWSDRDQVGAIPLPYVLAGYAERLSLFPAPLP
jgi:uncharacterized protein